MAVAIDYVIVLVPTALVLRALDLIVVEEDVDGELTGSISLAGVLLVIAVTTLYFTLGTARTGRTLGKVAMRCRVVRPDGRLLAGREALLRSLLFTLAVQTCVLGAIDGLWPLWDRRRQALHDKVVGSIVVTG